MTVAVEATRVAPGVIEHVSPFAEMRSPQDTATSPSIRRPCCAAGLDVDSSAPDEAALLWRKLAFLAPFALLTVDPVAVRQRLSSLPGGMLSSMLKDALAGTPLELDAIAGPILRAVPDGAPATRAVVAEITGGGGSAVGAHQARWP